MVWLEIVPVDDAVTFLRPPPYPNVCCCTIYNSQKMEAQNVFVFKKKDLIGYLILLQNASYFYHGDCQVYIKVERIV